MIRQNLKTLRWTVISLFAFLNAGSQIVAQSTTPTLDVGTVTLSLGLSLDTVHQQLEKAGYKYIESPQENGEVKVIVTREDITDTVKRFMASVDNDGQLLFRAGSLVSIMRKVNTSYPRTDRDLAESMYALVREYEREGSNHSCGLATVEETHSHFPNISARQVTISCDLGRGIYRSTSFRLVADTHDLQSQPHVTIWQELWRHTSEGKP
jgi:hypothetical protein